MCSRETYPQEEEEEEEKKKKKEEEEEQGGEMQHLYPLHSAPSKP